MVISDYESTYVLFVYAAGGMNFITDKQRKVAVGWSKELFGTSLKDFSRMDTIVGNTGLYVNK